MTLGQIWSSHEIWRPLDTVDKKDIHLKWKKKDKGNQAHELPEYISFSTSLIHLRFLVAPVSDNLHVHTFQ